MNFNFKKIISVFLIICLLGCSNTTNSVTSTSENIEPEYNKRFISWSLTPIWLNGTEGTNGLVTIEAKQDKCSFYSPVLHDRYTFIAHLGNNDGYNANLYFNYKSMNCKPITLATLVVGFGYDGISESEIVWLDSYMENKGFNNDISSDWVIDASAANLSEDNQERIDKVLENNGLNYITVAYLTFKFDDDNECRYYAYLCRNNNELRWVFLHEKDNVLSLYNDTYFDLDALLVD